MGKFTKKPLPRGTKLYGDAVLGPMSDIATSVTAKGLDAENYKRENIPWRITLCPTNLTYKSFYDSTNSLAFPFTLPPPQEFFNVSGLQSYDQVALTLEEICFSVDLRQEPAGVAGTAVATKLHGAAEVNEVQLTICEKQQWYFNNTMETHTPERVLFQRTYTPDDFASLTYPFFQADLNITLDPYKTYAVHVSCPKLNQNNNAYTVDFQLASPTISLKGKWTRFENTVNTKGAGEANPECQNAPLKASTDTAQTVTVATPAGGAALTAASINSGVNVLDNLLQEKVEGGYGPNSEMGRYGQTKETMGYDIIAVPLFTTAEGLGYRASLGTNYEHLENRAPYFTKDVVNNSIYDRIILPIQSPMEIHHVYCAWNLQSPFDGTNAPATHPTSNTARWQVGVSLGSGIKSDYVSYNQVAALEFGVNSGDATYYQNFLIDRYRTKGFGDRMSQGGTADPKWDVALLSVPLMYQDGGTTGVGYHTQGKPVFAGRGNSWTGWKDGSGTALSTSRRSNLPHYDGTSPPNKATATIVPNTFGLENFIEVSCKITETGGIKLEAMPDTDALSGQGGFWVYLVVKRASVQSTERLR